MKQLVFIVALFISVSPALTACSGNADKANVEQLASGETYTCTMHNEVMSDQPGECPKCDMKLVKQKMTAGQQKMKNDGNYVKPKE